MSARLFERAVIAVGGGATRDAGLLRYARFLPQISPGVECRFVRVLNWKQNPGTQELTTYEQAQRQLAASVAEHFGMPNAVCSVLTGDVIDRLLETIAENAADVVLLGHAAGHGARRSLARRLAMKAPCSVWMHPEGTSNEIRRVVAGVDYSETSAYALSLGARIAASVKAECVGLHVYFDEAIAVSAEYETSRRADEQEAFERFVAPLDTSGIAVRPVFVEGPDVVHAVERMAEDSMADLVVMGSRGKSRSASILLGSESDHMLMHAKMPVLIAKRRGERIGLLRALLDRDFRPHDPPRFG